MALFIPYDTCGALFGDCFIVGKCLGRCAEKQKKTNDERIAALESQVQALQAQVAELNRRR